MHQIETFHSDRAVMNKIVCTLAIMLLSCMGCRTYVGSDDIIETEPPKVIKSESGMELRRGMVLEVAGGKYILTFAERSMTIQHEKMETYYCGCKYYYLDKSSLVLNTHGNLASKLLVTPFALPLQWIWDSNLTCGPLGLIRCLNWRLHGDNAPGIGYCIAYLPLMHLFFTPFLRPPYAYEKSIYCEEIDKSDHRLISTTMRDRHIPVFAPDTECGKVTISHDGQTIAKNLSPDGKVEFRTEDFSNIRIDDREVEFLIEHCRWGQRWIVRSSTLIEPAVLRDWNLLSDNQCEYHTRLSALMRLEAKLGEKQCRKHLSSMIYGNGRLHLEPMVRAEVAICGAAPTHPIKSAGADAYMIGLWYEKANKVLAAKWFAKAAEQGNADAQFKLGLCYDNGWGVSQNCTEAVKWYRRAAARGNAEAKKAMQKSRSEELDTPPIEEL